MDKTVVELEKILKQELELYISLLELEEKKSGAILERDGSQLESLSVEQEYLLKRIVSFESRRNDLIIEYKRINFIDDIFKDVVLKDIILLMDEDAAHRLSITGIELRNVLLKIKSLHETNQKLLNDNIEFFNILLSGIKSTISVKTGYGHNGVEDSKVSGSVIFNKKI